LTNNGSLVQQLEQRLAKHLGVKHLICVANGSIALHLAYKALDLNGEVITTPFSFAATTSTLVWDGLTPVFADIHPNCFNLDPNNIEPMITENTSAILPVHVFGNPCQVEAIQTIADNHHLKVIYDAAHAFGTDYRDQIGYTQSVLNYGDISTISFHATKLFHTIEGGAVITNDDELARKIRLLINFGITSPVSIESVGTNAKMNEFEAAMGLCVLDEIDVIKHQRKHIWAHYQQELTDRVEFQQWNPQSQNNYAYAPVLFENEKQLLKVETKLKEDDILSRRYFYPSLETLDYLKKYTQHLTLNTQNSRDISSRILCLPIYPSLDKKSVERITSLIKTLI